MAEKVTAFDDTGHEEASQPGFTAERVPNR